MDLLAVMTAAAFITVMVSALMVFSVMVSALVTLAVMVVVMVAPGVRIKFKRTFRKRLGSSIRWARDSRVKLYPDIGKSHQRSHAYASADQSVSLYCLQEARKGAVSVSVGIYYLFVNDLSVFDVIQLKLLGMTEVLEDLSVFVCNCDPHCICSFLYDLLIDLDRSVFTVPACYQQPFSVNKGVSDLFLALS